jgi:hypothetical protein
MSLPPPSSRPPDNLDPRDYILDLSTAPEPSATPAAPGPPSSRPVSYLSIYFRCCNVYAPIYKNAAGTAYAGHCPRCRRPASVAIGPGGTRARIFQAE